MTTTGRRAPLVDLPGDPAAFHVEAIRRGWSDGLPLIPPTEARVEAMLAGTSRDPLDLIGVLAPRQGEATIHACGVNAVMAGCTPAHFPVIVAAIQGLADPAFNLDSVNTTTHPCGIIILASGPNARAAGIHGGAGCFGPAFPANVGIGRAVRLILLNIAGAIPGSRRPGDAGHTRQDRPLRHRARGRQPLAAVSHHARTAQR